MSRVQGQTKRIIIQPRDIAMLDAVFRLGYATDRQIAVLFPSRKRKMVNLNGVWREGARRITLRLGELKRAGYLESPESVMGSGNARRIRLPNEPALYFIGKAAVPLLAVHRGYDPGELSQQERELRKYFKSKRDNKFLYIEHRKGINDFRVALARALSGHPYAKWAHDGQGRPFWLEPRRIRNDKLKSLKKIRVTLRRDQLPAHVKNYLRPEKDEIETAHEPDAIFILQIGDHKIGFLYEKDRGTIKHTRLAVKLYSYYQWYRQGLHEKHLGVRQLRVLIETSSWVRLENIIARAVLPVRMVGGEEVGSGLFWLATSENIRLDRPESILEPIWMLGCKNLACDRVSMIDSFYFMKKLKLRGRSVITARFDES